MRSRRGERSPTQSHDELAAKLAEISGQARISRGEQVIARAALDRQLAAADRARGAQARVFAAQDHAHAAHDRLLSARDRAAVVAEQASSSL